MNKLLMALAVTAAMAAVTPGYAAMTKDSYKSTTKQIDATFKADKEQCKSLKANAKDICMAEAKAKQKIAKADAEADYKNTDKARAAARKTRADAEYDVAKEKCDDLAGNAKDVCMKEAKVQRDKARAGSARTERSATTGSTAPERRTAPEKR